MEFVQYQSSVYHALPSLHEANKTLRQQEGPRIIEGPLQALIRKYALGNTFAVSLVHRHFELKAGEKLVEFNSISTPWNVDNKILGGIVEPTSWVSEGEEIRPYEFSFKPRTTEPEGILNVHKAFVEAFFGLLIEYGLQGIVGLMRLPAAGFTGGLEVTQGRSNIILTPDQISEDVLENSTDTIWIFPDEKPFKMYKCACRDTGSSTNSNHNHIDGDYTSALAKMTSPTPGLRDAIVSKASSLRTNMTCVLQDHLMARGGSNAVYVLEFADRMKWTTRVPHDESATRTAMKSVTVLKFLKSRRPQMKVPDIYSEMLHEGGHNYIFMEYLIGEPLGVWNSTVLNNNQRHSLLNDLACFLLDLWTLPVDSLDLGGGRHQSYTAWLESEVDRGLRRSLSGQAQWGEPSEYLLRRARISELIPPVVFENYEPQAIKHGDLNAWNVIVTEEAVSGIIDWDTSQIVPLTAAIQYPLFIADIPGWRNDGVPSGMSFRDDQDYLEKAIQRLEMSRNLGSSISSLLQTSKERQFFELSLHNRRINDEYVKSRTPANNEDRRAALEQLDIFVSLNPSYAELPIVLETRKIFNK